jgi:hypothetical protein
MPIRLSPLSLCLVTALAAGSLPAAAQVIGAPPAIRTIDIPPSRIAPSEAAPLEAEAPPETKPAAVETPRAGGLVLDLPRTGASDTRVPPPPTAPSAEQLAMEAIAAAEAEKLRQVNSAQLSAAQAQLDRIAADKAAQQERLARYRTEAAAHAAAMSDYAAQLAAARADRERWEADVAACRAGDRLRCGVTDGRR